MMFDEKKWHPYLKMKWEAVMQEGDTLLMFGVAKMIRMIFKR